MCLYIHRACHWEILSSWSSCLWWARGRTQRGTCGGLEAAAALGGGSSGWDCGSEQIRPSPEPPHLWTEPCLEVGSLQMWSKLSRRGHPGFRVYLGYTQTQWQKVYKKQRRKRHRDTEGRLHEDGGRGCSPAPTGPGGPRTVRCPRGRGAPSGLSLRPEEEPAGPAFWLRLLASRTLRE